MCTAPSVPAVAPPKQAPRLADQAVAAAGDEERRRAAAARGAGGTIMTSPAGVTVSAPTAGRTLLG